MSIPEILVWIKKKCNRKSHKHNSMQKQRFLTLDNLVEDLIFLRTEN